MHLWEPILSISINTKIRLEDDGGEERKIINPIISYPEAVAFKNKYKYPFTETSISFTATSTAEVKFEATKTDPEISVVGVDEHFIDQFWFRN